MDGENGARDVETVDEMERSFDFESCFRASDSRDPV